MTNDSETFRDSLEDDNHSVSESSNKSSKSSSSSSTSSSSSSSKSSRSSASLKQARPTRLAQTFKKGDLVSELNKTRVLDKSVSSDRKSVAISDVKRANVKIKQSAPRVNSWIDPKNVKGTKHDEQKIKDWMTQKDKEQRKQQQEAKKNKEESEQRKREEDEMKEKLQKKNFEQWESQKKTILEQKMKRSQELKDRKKEKDLEKIEKLKYSEKAFQSWKSRKEEKFKEENKVKLQKERDIREERNRLKAEKERDQKQSFEKWCQIQAEAEEKKKLAQRKEREAEAELELLQEYRKRDAEEEYIQWKKEKSLSRSFSPKPAEHPLGWAPAGKSDGRHRLSPNVRPSSPGEPLSKTLASLQNGPSYHRKLKTVDVCCRKISFWCHCPSENDVQGTNGFHDESFQRSQSQPAKTSTPKASPKFSRQPKYYDYEASDNNGFGSPVQMSRHTTPISSRPSTPRRN